MFLSEDEIFEKISGKLGKKLDFKEEVEFPVYGTDEVVTMPIATDPDLFFNLRGINKIGSVKKVCNCIIDACEACGARAQFI